ncbi:unnamed protein product [Medioppia subpectinata]|uniref:eIF-4F 25 kDa subunit n=1 Tax=Medioppia subpectinata TaxID=1979941 RepID=A0A7R9KIC2_9ACAR|nr:unnamed protein product [Medioppia subpectinata]CAG2103865.1 unnamed protein product [Medioppia subpectinata]
MTSEVKKVESVSTTEARAEASGDSNEVIPKHPLQNQWQLWYFRPGARGSAWEDNLLDVTHFDTVEDFWALYNHIELASHLNAGSDYSVFKYGIRPMWEDEKNKAGGRWLFTFNKKATSGRQIDETWLEVLLCLIGEAFGEDSDQICGAVINIRAKMDKISVWTNDFKRVQSITNIGKILKQRTGYTPGITYEAHSDTIVKTGSMAKHLLQL